MIIAVYINILVLFTRNIKIKKKICIKVDIMFNSYEYNVQRHLKGPKTYMLNQDSHNKGGIFLG